MPITFCKETNTFKLDAGNSSYVINIFKGNYLLNLYYGAKIPDTDLSSYLAYVTNIVSFNPMRDGIDKFSMDTHPLEYPSFGTGDFRKTAVRINSHEGNTATDFRYDSHKIYPGKPEIPGLPATYVNEKAEAQTLEILTKDGVTGAELTLIYTVFENCNVITHSVRVKNAGNNPFVIEDLSSAFINLPTMDYTMVSLYGRHLFERNIERRHLSHGSQSIVSRRGASGHEYNPFVALVRDGSNEDNGDTYGFNFVYSGSFQISADVDFHEATTLSVGFNPEQFRWTLNQGEEFFSPETVTVYTNGGIGEMSRIFHKFYRNNLIRGKYKTEKRPLLINSWEAAFFDFDEEKLVNFAEHAKDLGIEMLVMDDGWFGHRDNDRSSLGDWYVYSGKINLKSLTERVHALGLKFGIWYEPEMISEDSDLFKSHPDWCLHVDGREHCNCRNQYVLDMSRDEVVENIFNQMKEVLSHNQIDYLKWDFNRNLTEVGSAALPESKQCELYHRFMLGTYKLMDKITKTFPGILLENCSGGGGRFDPGMLYYSPQIWCSDNTDPIDRLEIQFGTSICYPSATMGAHVSKNPRTGYATKGNIALWGTFGYELDPNDLKAEDRTLVKQQISEYHKYYELIRNGDLYRLIYPELDNYRAAWQFVSEDKSEALVNVVVIRFVPNTKFFLRLKGLSQNKMYKNEDTGEIFSGALLMNGGINLTKYTRMSGESYKIHLIAL